MSDNKIHIANDSMKPSSSQRSGTPNTTGQSKQKPTYTPPPQAKK